MISDIYVKNILEKLKNNPHPMLIVADFDGTLFASDWRLIKTPFLNTKSHLIMKRYQIPLIVITGRSHWNSAYDLQCQLTGLAKPDLVISGAGTLLYTRTKQSKLEKNHDWETYVGIYADKKWNKETHIQTIQPFLDTHAFNVDHTPANQHMIRIRIHTSSLSKILDLKQTIQDSLQGVKVFLAERIISPNTKDLFTGYLIIVPEKAGKDAPLDLILEKISHNLKQSLDIHILGDALIDIPLLTYQSKNPLLHVHTYAVNPTVMTRTLLKNDFKHQEIALREETGPEVLLELLKQYEQQLSPLKSTK